MKKKIEAASDEPTAPFWMTTYGDMVTLLLTFFILMISYANMDERKWAMASKSLQGALGVLEEYKVEMQMMQEAPGGDDDMLIRSEIYENIQEFEEQITEEINNGDITVESIKNGLLIQMGSKLLFQSAEAELKPEAFPILKLIGEATKDHAAEIVVAGHTDNIPINSIKYPSNWELSGSRAIAVVNYLIEELEIPPNILAATAYGEHRPLVPNETAADRQTNRRVEFAVTWAVPEMDY
ncbi:MAG: flagellar motor protein MotB [Candidatus Marinimicrobia bacterium]|nr:flagellar motor protein MotB [Candidatus Neomarinimicrobiota bacterium]